MNGINGAVKHVSASKVRIHGLALDAYDCVAMCQHIGSLKLYPRMASFPRATLCNQVTTRQLYTVHRLCHI